MAKTCAPSAAEKTPMTASSTRTMLTFWLAILGALIVVFYTGWSMARIKYEGRATLICEKRKAWR
jgi:hypothetical protein